MTKPTTATTNPITHHRTRLAPTVITHVIRAGVGVDVGHRDLQVRVSLASAARQFTTTAIAQAVPCEANVATGPQRHPGSRLPRPWAAPGSSGAFPKTAGTGATTDLVDRASRRFGGIRP